MSNGLGQMSGAGMAGQERKKGAIISELEEITQHLGHLTDSMTRCERFATRLMNPQPASPNAAGPPTGNLLSKEPTQTLESRISTIKYRANALADRFQEVMNLLDSAV